jgi:hypothetical protein
MSTSIPDQGLCGTCEETVRLRRDGSLYRHQLPYDPDGPVRLSNPCPGSGELPAVRLEMTFARWLHVHVARRDARDNPVTYLAQRMFHGCTRNPVKAVTDVGWAQADELHQVLHQEPGRASGCDWLCGYAQQAGAQYAEYRTAPAS